MRISADERDAGFAYWNMARANGKNARIFLDDEEIGDVVTADEDRGFIKVVLRDASGRLQLDASGENILTEIRKGTVRVEMFPYVAGAS